jgi:Nif-specific regulatory protein
MHPKLIAIAGPLKGVVFWLTENEVTLGREPDNQLCLSDQAISRRHCLLKTTVNLVTLTDLESRNGTFVNDLPINQRNLAHGDVIRLGEHHFLFLLHERESVPTPADVQLAETGLLSGATLLLQQDEAFYSRPERLFAALPVTERVKRELQALLQIGAALNQLRSIVALQEQLLELMFEVFPAERAAILLADRHAGDLAGDLAATCGRHRQPEQSQPINVSRTVVERVMREGIALVSNEVAAQREFSNAPSLLASQVRSLLAVPLLTAGRAWGMFYLDTSATDTEFDEDHLRLLTAISGIAAVAFENAQHIEWLESETQRLREEIKIEHGMLGESQVMRVIHQLIAKVAPSTSTVLIRGESGTGKELVARAIHRNSPRAQQPFVAINCAALTETLLESELFGHEKGAFTGAIAQKKGKFEIADGGTVFLDELGELAPAMQAKLLRVLQEQQFERVGGTRPLKVDVRLLAATNRDLEAAIKQGAFRQDLYYRLNVVSLTLPPLRERRADISLLASYFVAKYATQCKRTVRGLAPNARAALQHYDWPGNVRELENAIERAVVLGSTELILLEDLPEVVWEQAPATETGVRYLETLKETKRRLVLQALEQAQGNYIEAAQLLGMHVNNLHRLMKSLDLKPSAKK